MAWSRKTVLVVVAVVAALVAAVWALGDPAPNPNGPGSLPPDARVPADLDGVVTPPPPNAGLSTPSAEPDQPVSIGPGVTLEAGDDGNLPVSVRWVRHLDAPETIAVEGDTVYVADVSDDAFDVADGTLRWRVVEPSGEGFDSDGGVQIGTQGPGRLEVWAPWNYDLVVDKRTGDVVRLAGEPEKGTRLRRLPAPRQTAFRVRMGLPDVVATYPGGGVAWRITVEEPTYEQVRPIAVPGGMVLLLSSGDLVALDVPASS
jgi:hypothetical protein